MKGICYSIIAVLLITSNGCKQDFDITADYKEVPVVYGLLNWKETTHYIRIQKGYLIDGDASVAAGISDSIYYPDMLAVKLYAYVDNKLTFDSFTLSRVNGNDIGLPKETGAFASDSNILYTFNGTLYPAKRYKLKVTKKSNGFVFETKSSNGLEGITLISDFEINSPVKATKIHLLNGSAATNIVFTPAGNAGIYDLKIRFYYKEFSQANGILLKDTFAEILLLKSYIPTDNSNNIIIDLTAETVLSFLSNNLVHSNEIYREFNIKKGIQVMVAAGGTELATYMNAKLAQGGLASNESLPQYTNIEGGLGLLSSRYFKQVDSVLLSDRGLDSLACNDISKALRFKNHNGVICN